MVSNMSIKSMDSHRDDLYGYIEISAITIASPLLRNLCRVEPIERGEAYMGNIVGYPFKQKK